MKERGPVKEILSTGKRYITVYNYILCIEEIEKLKVQLSEKDRVISQMKERRPVKEIGIQFDYIAPSMGKRYYNIVQWI